MSWTKHQVRAEMDLQTDVNEDDDPFAELAGRPTSPTSATTQQRDLLDMNFWTSIFETNEVAQD